MRRKHFQAGFHSRTALHFVRCPDNPFGSKAALAPKKNRAEDGLGPAVIWLLFERFS
jgi:hypothetical protein